MPLKIEPDSSPPAGASSPRAVAWLIAIKAVPGARRDEVVGLLGERLKVRVSAPPEDGKANRAICQLLARELGIKPNAVSVVRGHSHPEKTVRIEGVTRDQLAARWTD
jgi:uncharacterized protein (TIGR00251 family)